MAMAISIETSSAAAPARIRTRRISSVAYAEELMASELKIARAFFLDSRSPISSSLASGRPRVMALIRARRRPAGVSGRLAAALATSDPSPVYRKNAAWGRSTRTRRSPILRPLIGRRLPLTSLRP